MSLLIRGGTVVTATDRWVGDIRCRDGRIAELGSDLVPEADEEFLDADGLLVFPGGVDPHVHMELPVAGTVSSDDFETGTAAALAGGTTTIVDFVHPEPGQPFGEALEARRSEAGKAVCDYGLHMAVTWWGDDGATQMADCVARGVPSFKIYLAYKATVGIDDEVVVQVMTAAAELPALVLVHAEHGEMVEHLRDRFAAEGKTEPKWHAASRPPELEGEATWRAAVLAGTAGARLYVVHVTCRQSVSAVAAARARGWRVSGETCPQYLLLDDSVYERPDFEAATFVIAPPIRPVDHAPALWEALENGDLEIVATDHCPFTLEQKRLGEGDFRKIPGGAAGVEHRLSLLWTHGVGEGRFDEHRFVDLVSTRPAKRFGLYPRKGEIAPGSDADLVLWDPESTATISAASHHHRCDRTPFEGFTVRGRPATVVAGGRVVFADGKLDVQRDSGRFLERALD